MPMTQMEPHRSEVVSILATVTEKPASYLAAARKLAPLRSELTPAKIVALATFTFDLLHPYIVVEGARRGLGLELVAAPFGQLEQQVLDPTSMLHAAKADVVVIAARIEDIAPELTDGFVALAPAEISGAITSHVERIVGLARALRERSGARIIVWNQPALARVAAGLADPSLETSQQLAIAELNRQIAAGCRDVPGTTIFDAARVAAEIGTGQWFDAKLAHLARCPLGITAQLAVARRLARHLRGNLLPPCKALVLDLDNTLWGGVLGEDGIGGIALGDGYPGSVFKAFQRALRSYRDRGVLLAIASKNNEEDVIELFSQHSDMVLRLDEFAARQIHWTDKAASLRAIAADLNIGIDSLAFFDDNPVERAWVSEQVPEITVIDVPADPLRYIEALDESGAFDHLAITAEDRMRADQYRAEIERKHLERSVGSVEQFLEALQMKVEIGRIDAATLPRVVQLLGKTNQFNVTTRRYSEGELAAMLAGDGAIGLWMRITDRYGDNGLVGVALAVRDDATTHRLDSFLMSCRVLGRQAEHALLFAIAKRARLQGATTLLGEFIPSKKNAPAVRFFDDTGFTAIGDRPNWWSFDLAPDPQPPRWLQIVEVGHE